MKKSAIVWLVLSSVMASAQERLRLEHEFSVLERVYLQNRSDAEGLSLALRYRPKLTYFATESLLLQLEPDFRFDDEGYAQGYADSITEQSEWQTVGVREAYGEWNRDWCRLKIGKQVFNWAVTDTVSPGDNLCPRDWTQVTKWERVGVPAVSWRLGYDHFIEAVYQPWFTPSKMPNGRWQTEPAIITDDWEETDGREDQLAVRVGSVISRFDVGLSYFDGYSYNPFFRLDASKMKLKPNYYRQRVYAASLTGEIANGFTLRSEIGWYDRKLGGDFGQWVIGIDREWSGIFEPTDSLYILLQYADGFLDSNNPPAGMFNLDFRQAFNDCLMAKAKYSFNDRGRWSLDLEGLYNTDDRDSYLQPSVTWQKDRWRAEIGLVILSGRSDTFMGRWGRNDHFFIELTLKF